MEFDKKKIKQIALFIVFVMVVYTACINYKQLFGVIAFIWDLFFPFALGAAIAFILNLPMRGIERFFRKLAKACKNDKPARVINAVARPVSLVLAICSVIAITAIVVGVVAPQLVSTIESVGVTIVEAFPQFRAWLEDVFSGNPEIENIIEQITIDWEGVFDAAKNFIMNGASDILSHTFTATKGIISAIARFFIALVFACYILILKEKLASQIRRVMNVTFKEKTVARINEVASLTHRTFCSFITGQCLEACILGLMFFICMLIFRFPYAMLISVLIAFTALIPIVGAFIGCIVGALLILMVDPLQAVLFVIMFLVLQQIEGNLIYPHVVGSSVGLPSIWVLMAVSIGGSLMGIAGMIIFIPIVSVIYSLFKSWVRNREKSRNSTECT